MKKYLFEATPLGKADKEVREFLQDNLTDEEMKKYRTALNHYRQLKIVQGTLKLLLYASIVTSVFATVGLKEAQILQKIASYLGTTFLFLLYAVVSYITMIRRENYHVQREILIARAS
ncbi:MAG: hypothetical protein ABEJ56_06405 [Candidatus Nanohaloarchaea archaeon]